MSIYSLNLQAMSTQQLEELACLIQEQLDVRRGWAEDQREEFEDEARRAAEDQDTRE
jgi:hypothetical protein